MNNSKILSQQKPRFYDLVNIQCFNGGFPQDYFFEDWFPCYFIFNIKMARLNIVIPKLTSDDVDLKT